MQTFIASFVILLTRAKKLFYNADSGSPEDVKCFIMLAQAENS